MTDAKGTQDGTGRGLIRFLEYAANRGYMNKNTSAAHRSAVTKVLEIDGERWEAIDLRELDVDQQIARFTNLRKMDYSSQSIKTYESRFRNALTEYFRFLDDPGSYRSGGGRETSAKASKKPSPKRPAETAPDREQRPDTPVAPPSRDLLVTYPFPVRETLMAYLQLPKDLSEREAQRVAKFVQSLAMETSASDTVASGD